MEKANVKAFIDGKEFSSEEFELWNDKRIKKACRLLHIKADKDKDLSVLRQKVIDKKVSLSHDEMLKLLHGRLTLSRFVMKLASVLSGNRRRASRATVLADGITAEEFGRKLDALMLEPTKESTPDTTNAMTAGMFMSSPWQKTPTPAKL